MDKLKALFNKTVLFFRSHRIVATFIYMFVAMIIIFTCAMFFLDYWTHHGEEVEVPSLKGMNYADAERELRNNGFSIEITDSIFGSTYPAGTVVEQSPTANANVKPGRTVYLTIVAFSPKLVTVPQYLNTSLRQGRAMFEGLGLKEVKIVEVESEYKDLVINAKYNGVSLTPGTKIPVTATVTIEVGRGYEPEEADSETEELFTNADAD